MSKRRLVVLLDGTWNSNDRGDEPTNVLSLLRSIPSISSRDGISQILYYGRGVGTDDSKTIFDLDKMIEGVTGYGITRNLTDAYRFLGNKFKTRLAI